MRLASEHVWHLHPTVAVVQVQHSFPVNNVSPGHLVSLQMFDS